MSRHVRFAICFALGAAWSSPVAAQVAPAGLIEAAAEAHAVFQKKGGLNAVEMGITEYWDNANKLATYEAAVYCSAYNFTAANFDAGFMAILKVKPTLLMSDANKRSRAALTAAGVDPARVPILMDEIRRSVIAATNRRF